MASMSAFDKRVKSLCTSQCVLSIYHVPGTMVFATQRGREVTQCFKRPEDEACEPVGACLTQIIAAGRAFQGRCGLSWILSQAEAWALPGGSGACQGTQGREPACLIKSHSPTWLECGTKRRDGMWWMGTGDVDGWGEGRADLHDIPNQPRDIISP